MPGWNNPNPNVYPSMSDRMGKLDIEEKIEGLGYVPDFDVLTRLITQLVKDGASKDVYRETLQRYIEKRIGGKPLFVPQRYGWTMIPGALSTIFVGLESFLAWRSRVVHDVPHEALYYPESLNFCCYQRAYISTCEIYPFFLFGLGIGGLAHPRFSAYCAWIWLVGRIFYAVGWWKVKPIIRRNGSFYIFGHFGVIACMLSFAVQQWVPFNVHKTRL